MKIFILIFVSSIAALLTDRYIYRRVISRHNFGRLWKRGYVIYAVTVDTVVVLALTVYNFLPDGGNDAISKGVMWIIGFFFLNMGPKLVYAVVSLGDYVVQRYRGGTSHIFGYAGTALAICLAAIMLYGMTYGRSDIRVERVELTLDNLPESFDGLRVVQFSDNHIGTLIRRDRFLNRMVDTVNSLRPDIVVNGGDIVNRHERELDSLAMSIFGRIGARYGVYSVLGNHDLGIYIKDTLKYPADENIAGLIRKERDMGWTVLRNRSEFISNGRDSIVVSGLDYPMDFSLRGHSARMTGADIGAAYGSIPDSYFNLAISHAPQLWNDMLSAGKGDLTLAGHVHAMQIKLKAGKWRWSPACLLYDRWSGLYEEDGRYLYINDGAGYVMFPMRIGVKPEVTLIVLRSGENRSEL